MEVRDAVEADAETLATMSDTSADAMGNIVHDRTVRVACVPAETEERESTEEGEITDSATASATGSPAEGSCGPADAIAGFVSFDAQVDTVHVTQLAGDEDVCTRLLEEPIAFARAEGMAVELYVPADDEPRANAAANAGFEDVGSGPHFDGRPTVRFRFED